MIYYPVCPKRPIARGWALQVVAQAVLLVHLPEGTPVIRSVPSR